MNWKMQISNKLENNERKIEMKLYRVKFNEQMRELIRAQAMIRHVYTRYIDQDIKKRLLQLDKDMTNVINLIGKGYEIQ